MAVYSGEPVITAHRTRNCMEHLHTIQLNTYIDIYAPRDHARVDIHTTLHESLSMSAIK